MKRRARGYLSQVADPVLPNQPLLSARSNPHSYTAFRPAALPMIQELDETLPLQAATDSVPRATKNAGAASITKFAAARSESHIGPISSVWYSNRATVAGSRTVPSHINNDLNIGPREAVEHADIPPAMQPSGSQSQSRLEHHQLHQAPHSLNEESFPEQQNRQSSAAPSTESHAEDLNAPAETSARGARSAKHSATPPRYVDSRQFGQTPLTPQIPRKERHSSGRQTRVHIGAVEIRSVVSQPASMPALAPQQPAETVAGRSASGRTAEPLARPLAWSFGLVQG